jgi:drug/metabolite transporter (DMT)-like permease
MMYLLITIGVVFVAACAQMLLKQGARKGYTPWWRQYVNGWVISGYTVMFLAIIANIWCMHQGVQLKELSIIESMSYLFVPILSRLIFKEQINKRKAVAIGIIIIGVIVFFL